MLAQRISLLFLALGLFGLFGFTGCGAGSETVSDTGASPEILKHLVVELTPETFDKVVLESDKPVLIDFWAPWCGPCLQMGPAVHQVAEEFEGVAVVAKLNVDEARDLADRYQIGPLPAFLIFKDGEVVGGEVGSMSAKQLGDTLRKSL